MNFLLLAISLFAVTATADELGNVIGKKENCQGSVFSSIQKVCQLVDQLGASCTITADTCLSARQEVFTGNMIELAGPGNIKAWNGFGGMGAHYSLATNCLMRDLVDLPEKKFTTTANASTFLGKVSSVQEVGFLSFNKSSAEFEGYHRLQACGPVVGCLDAYTQKFKLTPVKSNKAGLGLKAGQYEIREAHGLDLWAEGQAQGISVKLPGVNVPTPAGPFVVQPEFRFGRATGFNLSPYDGNKKSSLVAVGLKETSNRTLDVYGRTPGTNASTLGPIDTKAGGGWEYNAKGWISQIALGSRDADPKNPVWKQPVGVEYPLRPDFDLSKARSVIEKTPNAYLGASIEAKYSLKNLIPSSLLNMGCSGFVKICLEDASVFVKPTIDIGFISQLNFFENEQISWNRSTVGSGEFPVPNLQPQNMDQAKSASVFAAASAAARFALDAGLDIAIRLIINGFFTKIDKYIVNIHPRTTILEKIDKGYSPVKTATASSQASRIMSEKKYFQQYVTFKGTNEAGIPGVDGGAKHIQACMAKPTETAPMPPEPTYTPGDPEKLVEVIQYPCNICVGWDDIKYTDNSGKPQVEKGQVGTVLPASQAGFPTEAQWKCKYAFQSGCYDMCTMDTAGNLTVTRTALQMLKAGEAKDMPNTCSRGGP